MVSRRHDPDAWERPGRELSHLMRLLRPTMDVAAVHRVMIAGWPHQPRRSSTTDPPPVDDVPPDLEAAFRRQLQRCAPFLIVRATAAAWPDLALRLLDDDCVQRWHPAIVGMLAQHRRLVPAMIERARAHHRGSGEVVHHFVEAAKLHRAPELLDAAAEILAAAAEYEAVTETLVRGYVALDDLESAGRLAVGALTTHQTIKPLLMLLGERRCGLPEGAIEAIVGLSNPFMANQAVIEIEKRGLASEARQIQARLRAQGRDPRFTFSQLRTLAKRDPRRALDLATETVRRGSPERQPSVTFELELTRFLEDVRIDDADAARKVIGLAQWIRPHPMRDAIEWRAWPYLEP